MARSSGFEDMVEVAALLPWYISLGIAAGSYFLFDSISHQPFPPSPAKEMGTVFLIGLSGGLKYIFPFAFTVGALLSVFKAKRRAALVDTQSSIKSISNLSWHEFELMVGEAFRRKGYKVEERGGNGPDGGVDLVLYKDGRKTIVQCKRWSVYRVSVHLIREAYGVMVSEQADECIFVSSGIFTKDARSFASSKPIQLIDGKQLVSLLQDIKRPTLPQVSPTTVKTEAPQCPDCGKPMIKRLARRGRRAGKYFWGCTTYPSCLGTRD